MDTRETAQIAKEAAEAAVNAVARKRGVQPGIGRGSPQADVTTTVIATPETQGVLSSAAQFAENVVQGATSLAAGVAVTGAELYVGAGAKLLDAVGHMLQRGVDAMCSMQMRGHQAAIGAMQTITSTVGSVQLRGNEVLARSAAIVFPISAGVSFAGGEYGPRGTEARTILGAGAHKFMGAVPSAEGGAAAPITGAAQAAASGLYQGIEHFGQQVKEKADVVAGATKGVAETAGQIFSPALEMGKRATGLATSTFRDIEKQGEKAVGAGLESARKGAEVASQGAQMAKSTAATAATQAADVAQKAAMAAGHEAGSTIGDIERAGESAGELAAEIGEGTAHGTMQKAEAVGREAGSFLSAARNAVMDTLRSAEQQGENAGKALVSSPTTKPTSLVGESTRPGKGPIDTLKQGLGAVSEAVSGGMESLSSAKNKTEHAPSNRYGPGTNSADKSKGTQAPVAQGKGEVRSTGKPVKVKATVDIQQS